MLEAIATALQLDEAEHAHLRDLAAAANATPQARRSAAPPPTVRPAVQRILDGMTGVAAFVRNARLDVLAANQLGYALYAPVFENPTRPANLARFNFLDPSSRDFYPNWDDAANTSVALLRTEQAAIPTIAASPTSSVNSLPAAILSATGGRRTMCGCTDRAANTFITRSWADWT